MIAGKSDPALREGRGKGNAPQQTTLSRAPI
jgi:hypothetical protein